MCRKGQQKCEEILRYRDEAHAEWGAAEDLRAVRAAWGRLGGRVTYHRHGAEFYRRIGRRRGAK